VSFISLYDNIFRIFPTTMQGSCRSPNIGMLRGEKDVFTFRHHGYRQRYRLADQTRILNYKVMILLSKAACNLTFYKSKDIKSRIFFYYYYSKNENRFAK